MSRVALVTGAARGIGAATVATLCRQGYSVTALDICSGGLVSPGVGYPMANREQLDAVARAFPDQVLTAEADVRDREALESAVNATLVRFGRLDAVVAAAGVVVGGQSLWETPDEHLQTLFDVNVHGVWNTAAVTVPVMLAGADPSGCRFVAVASAAGERGLFKLAGYVASKHAVIGIVRGLAADLVGTGLTAVAVAPGSTDTPMLAATADLYDSTPHGLAEHQGIRRLIAPEEIAATIALCCSPAGAALNASVIRADGGFGG
ncbi:mycofactocin-coupled SDR family oxidoreductase [Nocardioides sp. cx-173]|uniref:mycofactocin-coupled SDR family oxidoreductase n=1 Tax=Nocardioides sp. cx-173 TaxID=2898796 RepID=UPI001E5A797D|nr:mycofactocin-coupled SDR family oxidoreductase [Nocardioides sp. cx-173]MCD4523585.1 mycofactocin-coupled SDR family oxidoreductase [Nocardioides sp. cx-173]UGB42079.1 mycofactocin-coupled SDR family oxidoreductase [Nocardioides sp. cx-173]